MTQENELQSLELNAGDQVLRQLVSREIAVLKRQVFLVIGITLCGLMLFDVIAYREHAKRIRQIEDVLRRVQVSGIRAEDRQSAAEHGDGTELSDKLRLVANGSLQQDHGRVRAHSKSVFRSQFGYSSGGKSRAAGPSHGATISHRISSFAPR